MARIPAAPQRGGAPECVAALLRQLPADFCYTITKEKPIVNITENQLAVYQPNGTVRMDLLCTE
jgi:hypothetical protein